MPGPSAGQNSRGLNAFTHRDIGGHGGGSTLIGKLDASQMRLITTTGRNNMPTFKDVYDANQIRDVSEYITSVLPKA